MPLTLKTKFIKNDFSKVNESKLIKDCQKINFVDFLSPRSTIDDFFTIFYSKTNEIIDKHVSFRFLGEGYNLANFIKPTNNYH